MIAQRMDKQASESQTIVQAKQLSKYFDEFCAVDHIDFKVYQGECLGLLGPNGAGKTTTMRMLLGHVYPSSGLLEVLNYPIPAKARLARAKMGVVPQQDNLDVDLTVMENLRSYASYFGLRGVALEQHLHALLTFVALENKQNTYIHTLSGGMRRRLILARALVNNPELLILDEPTTGLDPQARQLIWQRLRQLTRQGATIILTTHYLEEAERLCNRILIVDSGRILADGMPKALIQAHIEPHVIEVMGTGVRSWLADLPAATVSRAEMVGETLFCYCKDAQPLLGQLQAFPELEFLHRPANLEDVFLKLTGRELRDNG